MALVRRHWKTMVLCLAILVCGTAWLLLFSTNRQTAAQAQVTPPDEKSTADVSPARESLEEQTYYAVTKLRRQLMLRNEDMAALGCTGASSRAILEELLGWYETNREKLQQTRKATLAAKRAYRQAMRRINMGPKDEALSARVPQLLSAVGETAKQERELTESAIPVIEKKLSADQCSLWTSIRKQRHLPGLYRYAPNLSTEQKQNVQKAVRTAAYRRMTAKTEEQHKLANEAATAEANALSSSQQSVLAEVKAKMQKNLPEILKASQNALPAPELPALTMPELAPDQEELVKEMLKKQSVQ
jgi:hypothetical protein